MPLHTRRHLIQEKVFSLTDCHCAVTCACSIHSSVTPCSITTPNSSIEQSRRLSPPVRLSTASCQSSRHTADVTSPTFEVMNGNEEVSLSPVFWCAPDSSVGIATRYGPGRSVDRIPVVARFSLHVQTCPRAHPSSYTMGTGSFLGVKRPGCGVDHRPAHTTRLK